jgi:hypothetical protein
LPPSGRPKSEPSRCRCPEAETIAVDNHIDEVGLSKEEAVTLEGGVVELPARHHCPKGRGTTPDAGTRVLAQLKQMLIPLHAPKPEQRHANRSTSTMS